MSFAAPSQPLQPSQRLAALAPGHAGHPCGTSMLPIRLVGDASVEHPGAGRLSFATVGSQQRRLFEKIRLKRRRLIESHIQYISAQAILPCQHNRNHLNPRTDGHNGPSVRLGSHPFALRKSAKPPVMQVAKGPAPSTFPHSNVQVKMSWHPGISWHIMAYHGLLCFL